MGDRVRGSTGVWFFSAVLQSLGVGCLELSRVSEWSKRCAVRMRDMGPCQSLSLHTNDLSSLLADDFIVFHSRIHLEQNLNF